MDPIMNSFSREQMEYIVELFNPCMDDYRISDFRCQTSLLREAEM